MSNFVSIIPVFLSQRKGVNVHFVSWLGHTCTWSMNDGIVEQISMTGHLLFEARYVTGMIGQIIYMQSVLGLLVRLCTRYLYAYRYRSSWNAVFTWAVQRYLRSNFCYWMLSHWMILVLHWRSLTFVLYSCASMFLRQASEVMLPFLWVAWAGSCIGSCWTRINFQLTNWFTVKMWYWISLWHLDADQTD